MNCDEILFFLRDLLHLFLYPLFHYFTIQSSMINKPSGYELNWLKRGFWLCRVLETLPYNSIDKWLFDRFISIKSVSTITFDFIHFYVPILFNTKKSQILITTFVRQKKKRNKSWLLLSEKKIKKKLNNFFNHLF